MNGIILDGELWFEFYFFYCFVHTRIFFFVLYFLFNISLCFFRLDRGKFEECKTIVLSQQNNEELWKSIQFKIFDVPNLNENEKGKL